MFLFPNYLLIPSNCPIRTATTPTEFKEKFHSPHICLHDSKQVHLDNRMKYIHDVCLKDIHNECSPCSLLEVLSIVVLKQWEPVYPVYMQLQPVTTQGTMQIFEILSVQVEVHMMLLSNSKNNNNYTPTWNLKHFLSTVTFPAVLGRKMSILDSWLGHPGLGWIKV